MMGSHEHCREKQYDDLISDHHNYYHYGEKEYDDQ